LVLLQEYITMHGHLNVKSLSGIQYIRMWVGVQTYD